MILLICLLTATVTQSKCHVLLMSACRMTNQSQVSRRVTGLTFVHQSQLPRGWGGGGVVCYSSPLVFGTSTQTNLPCCLDVCLQDDEPEPGQQSWRFSVASYNILADKYVSSAVYPKQSTAAQLQCTVLIFDRWDVLYPCQHQRHEARHTVLQLTGD